MARARSSLELDLDPDVTIGLGLPMQYDDVNGFFPGHSTTLSQAGSNLRNLLLTNKGERVGQPTFGADLLLVLFEPMSENLLDRLEESIKEAIANWLPYISVNKLEVIPDESVINQLNIYIEFYLTMNPGMFETITLSFATEQT
jgi:phage baseplate assembly protein W|tara:strand:+ start:401 stop:832 length:432 start_codon:yes stop_codon:yes gene_type:complete